MEALALVEVDRRADEAVDPGFGEGRELLSHLILRSNQGSRIHQLVGDRVVCLVALAVEVEALDLVGDVAEAESMGEVDVEVGLPRAHATEIKQESCLDDRACRVEVAVDRDLNRRRDLQVGAGAPAFGEPRLEVFAPGLLELVGREEDRDPAVADLGRHLDRLAPDRADENRDLVADRVEVELQRLALPGAAFDRQLPVVAGVLERASCER